MAHSRSALKRWRQNERHRARNKAVRTSSRTAIKKARTAVSEGGAEAEAVVREAMSVLDRAAKRRVIHPNAAARHKSRLMSRLNKVAAGEEAAPKRARKSPAKKTATKAATKAATKGTKTAAKRASKTAKK